MYKNFKGRVLAAFVLLFLVAGLIVFASTGYEDYEIDSTPDSWLEDTYINAHDYTYEEYDYTQGYDYENNDGYIDDEYMYIGDAPQYIYYGYVNINVDNDGYINIYPHQVYGALFDGDYLLVSFPSIIEAEDVSTSLPYGWTYEVSHRFGVNEEFSPPISEYEQEMGIGPSPMHYTLVAIRHTWNDGSGFIGIQPFIDGIPGGYDIFLVDSHATLLTAITGTDNPNPNRVAAVTQDFNQTATITIPAGRSIIIASYGTNITTHTGGPETPYTITHTGTAASTRQFNIDDGASLTLSAITLDGNAVTHHDADVQATTRNNRGGVNFPAPGGGGTVSFASRYLIMQNRATITRAHWTNSQGSAIEAQGNAVSDISFIILHPGSRLHNNMTTVGWGGALHTRNNVHIEMYGGIIENNTTHRTVASGNGHSAGVHVGTGGVGSLPATFTMHDGIIRNNFAHATHPGWVPADGGTGMFRAGGGGVFVHRYNTFNMYDGEIYGNILTATRTGEGGHFLLHGAGVLTLANTTIFNMYGGYIHNNHVLATAEGVDGILAGGGVGMFGGTFTMDGPAEIHSNSAVFGGGVFVSTGGNETTRPGPGVNPLMSHTHFIFNRGSIHSNRADYGAGVGVSSLQPLGNMGPTMFTLDGGMIYNNRNQFGPLSPPPDTPPLEGGGVWVFGTADYQATFNFRGGVIGSLNDDGQGNRALRGGGLWIGNGAEFNMELNDQGDFGMVLHNEAAGMEDDENFGGGIYATNPNSEINLGVGLIQGNTARNGGGVAVTDYAIFNKFGTSEIDGNIALATAGQTANGGGVFGSSGSGFNLAPNRPISNNIARAIGDGAVANGGAIAIDGNIFDMGAGASINGNRAEAFEGGVANGGGLALLSGDFTLLSGRILDGNMATAVDGGTAQGGGVAVLGGNFITQVNISGSTATASGAGATVNGGGAFVSGGTFAMAPDTSITGNIATATGAGATINGGGLAMIGGAFTLIDTTTITGNTSTAAGGVINGGGAAVMGGTFYMEGGNVYANSATNGGGIYVIGDDAYLIMTGGVIGHPTIAAQGNSATRGGGVWVGGGATFNMQAPDGHIIGNDATGTAASAGGGGVFMIDPDSSFNFSAGNIEANRANRGAGVLLTGQSQFTMSGGFIQRHRTNPTGAQIAQGGGVHVRGAAYFTMTGGTIGHISTAALSNTAVRGGGVWVGNGSEFIMAAGGTGGIISRNAATTNESWEAAGGVQVESAYFELHNGLIYFNTASSNGGGVALHNSEAIMTGGTIDNNRANASGGGICVRHSTFEFSGGYIINNRAIGVNMNGGGILISGTSFVEMSGGVIRGNTASTADGGTDVQRIGGGISMTGTGGELIMTGGLIENNTAMRGGGVDVRNGAIFTMHGGTIRNNRQTFNGNLIQQGGGVRVNGADALFTMTGGTIGCNLDIDEGNRAINGGGVWVGGGARFFMADHTVEVDDVYITTPGTGEIIGNLATINGGGAFVTGASAAGTSTMFEIQNGTIAENSANTSGGGVHVNAGGSLELHNGFIRNNLAGIETLPSTEGGGGVFIIGANSSFYMSGGEIHDNNTGGPFPAGYIFHDNLTRGGGVYVRYAGATFEMSGGRIRNNSALGMAGGVSVNEGASFEMTNGYIHNNRGRSGGGVHLMNYTAAGLSTFVMHNGEIYENDAVGTFTADGEYSGNGAGGGVCIVHNAFFTMHNGIIRGNNAVIGGGVWLRTDTAARTSEFIMHNGTIRDNFATRTGGGVCLGSLTATVRNTTFTMHNGSIFGNEADLGGGVFVANGTTANMARFNMYGGTIGGEPPTGLEPGEPNPYANTARYGGGIYLNSHANSPFGAIFELRGNAIKHIVGNEAEYDGGGVWVSAHSTMTMLPAADSVYITHNQAGHMGGGIFTDHYEYRSPITETPPFPGGATTIAYSNLTLIDVTFNNNRANKLWWPPSNRAVLTNIGFATTSQVNVFPVNIRHPLNNYDINFRAERERFDFFKTDNELYFTPPVINLLEGAQFRLFRNINPEADPQPGTSDAYLVTDFTDPGPIWEEVFFVDDINISPGVGSTTPLGFYMDPRHVYQLVEVMTPVGFARPMGQWRICFDRAVPDEFFVTPIGGFNIPSVLRSDTLDTSSHPIDPRDNLWYLANWLDINMLPLTGGSGITIVTVAGAATVAAAGLWVAVKKHGHKKQKLYKRGQ